MMMKRLIIGLAALALIEAVAGDARANLILNGSFEDPPTSYRYVNGGQSSITGWETIHTGVEQFNPAIYSTGTAQDGLLILDLNTDFAVGGGLWQTIATNPGDRYALSFYEGTWDDTSRGGTRIGLGHLIATVGAVSHSFTVENHSPTIVWTNFSLDFTAVSASTTITFENFDLPNVTFSLLDNVSVEALSTPLPSTLVMSSILFGMFGAVWSYKRLKRTTSVVP